MTLEEFKNLLLVAAKTNFPQAGLALQEKRSIIKEPVLDIVFKEMCDASEKLQ